MNELKRCFDGWANTIVRLHPNFSASVRGKVESLKRLGVDKGDCALDVGCGSAPWAEAARQCGYNAVGVDFSSSMISLAKSFAPDVSLVCENFLDWRPDETYDLIIAGGNQVTYYEDLDAFMEKAVSLLADDGVIIVSLRDFRRVLKDGSNAHLLTHVKHPDQSETVVVDYRNIVEGKRAACSFWVMAPCDADEPRQWVHEYEAYLHSLAEVRACMASFGLEPSRTLQPIETGYGYPIVLGRKR